MELSFSAAHQVSNNKWRGTVLLDGLRVWISAAEFDFRYDAEGFARVNFSEMLRKQLNREEQELW